MRRKNEFRVLLKANNFEGAELFKPTEAYIKKIFSNSFDGKVEMDVCDRRVPELRLKGDWNKINHSVMGHHTGFDFRYN